MTANRAWSESDMMLLTGGVASLAGAAGLAYVLTTENPPRMPWAPRPVVNDDHAVSVPGAGPLFSQWALTTREVRYGVLPAGHPDRTTYTIPAGAREIPLVLPRRTPLAPGRRISSNNREDRRRYLRAIQAGLRAAGRTDIDARCAALLIAIETGWGYYCWCNNLGNQKAQGSLYVRDLRSLQLSQTVYTTNTRAIEVYLLRDRVRSVDGYPGYSVADGYAHFVNFFERNHYAMTLDGYRRGGLEGLVLAEQGLARKGYSGAPEASRVARARGYWEKCQRMLGDEFEDMR